MAANDNPLMPMDIKKSLLHQHKLTFLLPLGLALGLLAQWLFIGRPLGISWLIFSTILLVSLILAARRSGLPNERSNIWLWPALIFFAAMVFLRANPFLTFLNVSATMVLLSFIFYFYAAGTITDLPLSGIVIQPLRMAGQSLANAAAAVHTSIEPLADARGSHQELAPVLRGGLLALPVLLVFTPLLASADLVFSAQLQRLLIINPETLMSAIGRGIFAGLVALAVCGATATAVLRGLSQAGDHESWIERQARVLPMRFSLGATETTTILILISALFLAFIILQFKYLFGGEANITQAGFTYAEYARRGFFELILVAFLSLGLILFLNWLTRRESKGQIKWFNTLSTILIGLVLLLLFTAFWRMRLYELAYGYTELRLIVLVFDLWLGLLLVWFLITLWRAPQRFAPGLIIAAIGFVTTLNLINPDALIVRHNLQRYHETADLDIFYLSWLSDDAVPALSAAWPEINEDEQIVIDCAADDLTCDPLTMGDILGRRLHARYEIFSENEGWQSWPAYHLARYRAAQALIRFAASDVKPD
jgi:hypothetical protein